jgi:hypothetical protein
MPCPAVAVADGVAAVADGVVAAQPASPITAENAAIAIHPLLFDSNRRALDWWGLVRSLFMMAPPIGNLLKRMPTASMSLLWAVYVSSVLLASSSGGRR